MRISVFFGAVTTAPDWPAERSVRLFKLPVPYIGRFIQDSRGP